VKVLGAKDTPSLPDKKAPGGEHPPIPFQDLVAQHASLEVQLKDALNRVLASGRYIANESEGEVFSFEREIEQALNVKHAIAMSSGTDALLAMLMALDVGPGDEVVTTPFSFVASADVIARLGARPRFVDIDRATLNIDATRVAAAIGPRTKAVLAVHLFGRAADGPALRALCDSRGIPLLEDAAQAIAAVDRDGRSVGNIGHAAALSFFPSKNLGALGDAGMVLTGDQEFAGRLRQLRTHGSTVRFHHDRIGGNFRMDELQAAVLREKLPHLATWTAARRERARHYLQRLQGLPLILPADEPGMVWNQFVVRVQRSERPLLVQALAQLKIATAIYYPKPLHQQPCFSNLGHSAGAFPEAERATDDVLALPLYPELSLAQVERICSAIHAFYARS